MADKKVKIVIDAVDNASKVLKDVGDSANKTQIDFKKLATVGGGAMLGIGAVVAGLGKEVLSEAGKFEQYQLALNSMIGDTEKASKLYQDLIAFAKKTPFSQEGIIQSAKQLIAMGSTTEDVMEELKALGDVSAGLGVPMERLALNFGQIRTQGTLTGRELRDFNVAGVPLIDELVKQFNKQGGALTTVGATSSKTKEKIDSLNRSIEKQTNRLNEMKEGGKENSATYKNLSIDLENNKNKLAQLGPVSDGVTKRIEVTKEEIVDMVSEGKIGFEEVRQAFIDMSSEGGRFDNLMAKQAETLLGKWETMNDSLQQLKVALGSALIPVVTDFVNAITPMIDKFAQWAKDNPEIVKWLFILGGAIGVFGGLLLGLAGLITAVSFVLGILGGFIGVLASIIIAILVGAIVYLISNWEILRDSTIEIWNQIGTYFSTKFTEISNNAVEMWGALKKGFSDMGKIISKQVSIMWGEVLIVWNQSQAQILESTASFAQGIKDHFKNIGDSIGGAIDKFKEWSGLGREGGLGIPRIPGLQYQHGGTVPGGFNQPVPAVLHGGERVIPRTGVDVNSGGSGGGVTVNLTIQGDVNSTAMLDQITEAVKSAIGRDNELSQIGVTV